MSHPAFPVNGVRDTSKEALIEHKASGKLGQQEQKILEFMRIRQLGLTRNEIANCLNMRLSAVCGRVNTLIKAKLLQDEPRRRCSITGENAHVVTIVEQAPIQEVMRPQVFLNKIMGDLQHAAYKRELLGTPSTDPKPTTNGELDQRG